MTPKTLPMCCSAQARPTTKLANTIDRWPATSNRCKWEGLLTMVNSHSWKGHERGSLSPLRAWQWENIKKWLNAAKRRAAITRIRKIFSASFEQKEQLDQTKAFSVAAFAYAHMCRYTEALSLCQKSQDIFTRASYDVDADQLLLAEMLYFEGFIYYELKLKNRNELKEYDKALRSFVKSLTIKNKKRRTSSCATARILSTRSFTLDACIFIWKSSSRLVKAWTKQSRRIWFWIAIITTLTCEDWCSNTPLIQSISTCTINLTCAMKCKWRSQITLMKIQNQSPSLRVLTIRFNWWFDESFFKNRIQNASKIKELIFFLINISDAV